MGFRISVLVLAAALASCSSKKTTTYTLSGLVSGLSGSGLVLQINGNTAPITSNGPVTIESGFDNGTAFIITVKTQPSNPSQTCAVGNPTGTFDGGSISNVIINCVTNTYTLGGTISGLSGASTDAASVALDNNGLGAGDYTANGAFTIKPPIPSGSAYAITVKGAPSNPAETCTVTNGTGTIGSANVTNVAIVCVPVTFAVGGSVSGLTGSGLVVTNGSDSVTVNANGTFTFPTVVASGAAYAAGISTQPTSTPQQNCLFVGASESGFVGGGPVTSISIRCINVGSFLYVTNSANNTIAGYAIDPLSGSLTPVAGSPFATGSDPISLSLSPFGQFAYVLDGDGTISQYRINSTTGVLTAVPGSPYALTAASTTSSLKIGPSDEYAYISQNAAGSAGLSTYNVNKPSGVLSVIADGAVAAFGTSLIFDPTGEYAYAIFTPSTTTSTAIDIGFSVTNATSGLLTPPTAIKPPAPNVPAFLAIAPVGEYLYASGPASLLLAYRINPTTGAVTAAPGSPFAKTGDPGNIQGLALDPGGSFAYLTDCQCLRGLSTPGEFLAFALNNGAYSVTPIVGEPFAAGLSPGPLVFDPSGKFAYAGNAVSVNLTGYSLNASNGVLTPLLGSPFSVGTQTGSPVTISVAILP
jgi:6-phosphogluconolactonase (cycloisomerase 2 family)